MNDTDRFLLFFGLADIMGFWATEDPVISVALLVFGGICGIAFMVRGESGGR